MPQHEYIPNDTDHPAQIHVSKVQRVGGSMDGIAMIKFEITGLSGDEILVMPTSEVHKFLGQIRACLDEAEKHNEHDT